MNCGQNGIAANLILKDAYSDDLTKPLQIGDYWLKRFLKRYP